MTDHISGLPRDKDAALPSSLNFPVVGLGASAGGLVALKTFLEQMPNHSGMAFVVILHLSPRHESHADAVLQRSTGMPVTQVHATTPIQANHVYVISPTHELRMSDGVLQVKPAERPRGRHIAIDQFFRTLGEAHQDRAMGVVLSGTGADGSVGLARIKEQGGVTLAQAPEDAEYDDMPRNAIATGRVDFVLPVAEMPGKLLQLWENARQLRLPKPAPDAEHILPTPPAASYESEHALREVLEILLARSGHDFRHYKRATVLRRIERRMQVRMVRDITAYRDLLGKEPDEPKALLDDMLIGVTNFFRDRESFEALERDVIPELFAGPDSERPRIWVPACSSGEEAYSLAILLADHADSLPAPPLFQVFATDIDEQAIAVGRAGVYPESILTDVPPARLRKFFTREQGHYRIGKPVRDRVLFAVHNMLRDPPFSRIDLISCRNLLIYLEREVQARLLEIFHFALRPGGFLFLGNSESADAAAQYFEPIDKKNRLYRARVQARSVRQLVSLPITAEPRPAPQVAREGERSEFSYAELHRRALEQYASPSVVVDADYNIVHMSAGAGRYLRFTAGEPTANLTTVIDPALRLELRTTLFQALHTSQGAEAQVRIERPGQSPRLVKLIAQPFSDKVAGSGFLLVLFEEIDPADLLPVIGQDDKSEVLLHLEQELQRTKDRLQATIEQSETSSEELKASNEELQAINEELRSASEELETSKEELQSVNEELVTVNYELKAKVEETAKVNDDLQNFISSTDIATVFVDAGLRIKRYTPRAELIFNIIPGDVGRCLLDITHRLDYPDLAEDAAAAFETLQLIEREIRSTDGRWYVARVLPYRTIENRIDGAVLTFVDITSLRSAEAQIRLSADQIRASTEAQREPAIILLDAERRVVAWDAGASELLGFAESEMVGQPLDRIYLPADLETGASAKDFADAAREGRISTSRRCLTKRGDHAHCSGVLSRIHGAPGVDFALVLRPKPQAEAPQSGRVVARESTLTLRDEFLAVMSHELKNPLNLISVSTEVVARTPGLKESPSAGGAIETIRRAIRTQTKIIDDLLDMSRIRTGKLALKPEPVDVAAIVNEVMDVARLDRASAEVDFHVQVPDTPVMVRADAARLEQIVWNLVSNALKFTPADGQITLMVGVEENYVRLRVRDTGRGIDPQFLPRIFELFGQGPGNGGNRGGLGIGLSLVKQLVELHGGRIEAQSAGLNRGSTFTVWLPRFTYSMAGLSDVPHPEATGRWDGMRLLIVDDDAAATDALAQL
ncbi:MAG TPA: CheR family methyltransferase, partial [Xanthomonadaceae bacterium]|nr:CheR family methyltransferase [Xanthomonadaceae bacterium]